MNKRGFRIILALVLTLVLIVGSVSTVSAAKPVKHVTVNLINITATELKTTFWWNNYPAGGYEVAIIKDGIRIWEWWFPTPKLDPGVVKMGQVNNLIILGANTTLEGNYTIGQYYVVVQLTNKNGKPITPAWDMSDAVNVEINYP